MSVHVLNDELALSVMGNITRYLEYFIALILSIVIWNFLILRVTMECCSIRAIRESSMGRTGSRGLDRPRTSGRTASISTGTLRLLRERDPGNELLQVKDISRDFTHFTKDPATRNKGRSPTRKAEKLRRGRRGHDVKDLRTYVAVALRRRP